MELLNIRNISSISKSYVFFFSSYVYMSELDHKKQLSAEELMLLNGGIGEDSWESLRL